MTSQRIAFGIPLYNNARHLPEALESLLSQTYADIHLALIDDCSSDHTPDVARQYAVLDRRVTYVRNDRRLGYVGNANKAFSMACELFPRIDYFAWGSDHDVWHPRWVESLLRELDGDPECVLTYPLSVRISDDGEFRWEPRRFDTRDLRHRDRRFREAFRGMAAGDMIYGLFRRRTLERAGGLHPVLLPDRLLLSELSLYGRFRQVPEVLWYRRYWGLASYERQRAAFFPSGYPLYSYLPWWTTHGALLFWRLAIRGYGQPEVGGAAGVQVSLLYGALAVGMQVWRPFRRLRRVEKWFRKRQSAMRKRFLPFWHRVSVVRPRPGGFTKALARARRSLAEASARTMLQNRLVRAFVKGYLVPLASGASNANRMKSTGQPPPVANIPFNSEGEEIRDDSRAKVLR